MSATNQSVTDEYPCSEDEPIPDLIKDEKQKDPLLTACQTISEINYELQQKSIDLSNRWRSTLFRLERASNDTTIANQKLYTSDENLKKLQNQQTELHHQIRETQKERQLFRQNHMKCKNEKTDAETQYRSMLKELRKYKYVKNVTDELPLAIKIRKSGKKKKSEKYVEKINEPNIDPDVSQTAK